jgi:hypothetical protein
MSKAEPGPFPKKKDPSFLSHYDDFLNLEAPDEKMLQDILTIVDRDVGAGDLERIFWSPNFGKGTYNLRRVGKNIDYPMTDVSSRNGFMMWLESGISNHISHMMIDKDYRTLIIKNTVSGHSYQNNVFTRPAKDNLCRDNTGKLFTKKDLKYFTRFANNARGYMASALIHGDREALEIAMTFKENANFQTIPDFIRLSGAMGFTIHKLIHDGSAKALSPSMYFSKLISLKGEELTHFLQEDYRKDLLLQHGDLIFEHLFKASEWRNDPEFDTFVTELVDMGVDWYAGLVNAMESPVNRLDIASREREPLMELADLFKRREASRRIAILIFKAQPDSVKQELCLQQSFANKLFQFTGDESLMPYISAKLKRETLTRGLEL